jgi:AraC family transcriptional regulator
MVSPAPLELSFGATVPVPVARAKRSWGGFSAEHVRLEGDSPYDFKSEGQSHYLALHDIALRDGELRIDGLPVLRTRDLRDTLTFVPRGCAIEGWAHPELRANSFTAMYFHPELVREELGSRYASEQPRPFAYARNAPLQGTLTKLGTILAEPDADPLHAESLCLLASLEVFGVLADRQGRLSDRQVGAVTDFVEAHLGQPIGLDDLARVTGLSRFHFSRSFKAATGESPHAFVQRRRIERAEKLLQAADMSIEAVALAVGYSGAPQFRRVFREVTGISPLKYRISRR